MLHSPERRFAAAAREVAAAASVAKKRAKEKTKDPASESRGRIFVERRGLGGNEVARPVTRALN